MIYLQAAILTALIVGFVLFMVWGMHKLMRKATGVDDEQD